VTAAPSTPNARYTVQRQVPRILWPLLALTVILLYNLIYTQGFFRVWVQDHRLYGSLIDVLRNAVPVLLVSAGMTLVIATGGVDLSVGAVMAISGTLCAKLLVMHGYPLAGAIAVALLVSLACGLWNGLLVAYLDIPPIVATLVLMVSGRGIAQLIASGQNIYVENRGFDFVNNGAFLMFPFPVILALLAYLLVGQTTRRTALGLFVESVGNNPIAARYAGVNARVVKLLTYAVTGLGAGVAGIVYASGIRSSDAHRAGLYLELDAILAVLIGGTALTGGRYTLAGTVLGALIIETTTTMILTRGVALEVTLLVKAIIVLVVALFQADRFRSMLLGLFRRGGAGGTA
jgi:ribose/xylose/arabinose/galactoside ABC-type transport system permease subunit